MDGPNGVVLMCLAVLSRRIEPKLMPRSDVLGHFLRRDDVILEISSRTHRRDTTEHPEECRTNVFHRFHSDAARSVSWHEGFHLNMDETTTVPIAAKNVHIGSVAERDDG